MNNRMMIILTVVVAAVSLPSSAAASTASGVAAWPGGHGWGTAQQVPGLAALDQGAGAAITSMSCDAAGNCSAGGYYSSAIQPDGFYPQQAFVVSRIAGTWKNAVEVPGVAALNQGRYASVTALSCASAGYCTAVGRYVDGNSVQPFVVSQTAGTWQTAVQAPGIADLEQGGYSLITSVSCGAPGDCSAGGWYADSAGDQQAFIVSQTEGVWHAAVPVPGIAAHDQGGGAETTSVSCVSAGTCTAGGFYWDSTGSRHAFVIAQTDGSWHTAVELPGTEALDPDGYAAITSMSCVSADNCTAGGSYDDGPFHYQDFVVSHTNGTWQTPIEVPGTATLNQSSSTRVTLLSCASAGNCSAGGAYFPPSGSPLAFLVSQTNGIWHTAGPVHGTSKRSVEISSLSCAPLGDCIAGGDHGSNTGPRAFLVSQSKGTWRKAFEVPGIAALEQDAYAATTAVSCGAPDKCSAGGWYTTPSHGSQAFVISRT